jgi:DNA-binding MarR family transcriptional regulator
MSRFHRTVPVDDYVIDVLMRDLVGHDQHPAAFIVFLWLYRAAAAEGWRPISASLRTVAEATGLCKSAVQTALERLRQRELIRTSRSHRTATRRHRVLRHWRR